MATAPDKSLENWIWDAACSIRGAKDAGKYKDYILPLIFTKRLCDVFDDELNRIAEEVGGRAKAFKLVRHDKKLVRFYLPLEPATRNLIATVLFVVVALTDWLDGYLARKLNQTSSFGAFLDPVADKFLVCAALLILLQLDRVNAFVALVIIGREIAISALREWMAQIGASRSVAVHVLGKLKTVVQMVAIPFLLFDGSLFGLIDTRIWGTALIYLAAVLTIWSMVYYMKKALPEIRARVK
jgi:CDP-diacylglycerol--glycerol-3-phosphate 3-phosphatidyltransferase